MLFRAHDIYQSNGNRFLIPKIIFSFMTSHVMTSPWRHLILKMLFEPHGIYQSTENRFLTPNIIFSLMTAQDMTLLKFENLDYSDIYSDRPLIETFHLLKCMFFQVSISLKKKYLIMNNIERIPDRREKNKYVVWSMTHRLHLFSRKCNFSILGSRLKNSFLTLPHTKTRF